jgi:hypothetical protein
MCLAKLNNENGFQKLLKVIDSSSQEKIFEFADSINTRFQTKLSDICLSILSRENRRIRRLASSYS